MLKKLCIPLAALLIAFTGCEQASDSSAEGTTPVTPPTIVGITVSPTTIENLQISDSVSILIKANYSDGSQKNVVNSFTFSTSDHYRMSTNVLTAIAEGSGNIEVTYKGFTADIPYSTVENLSGLEILVDGNPLTSLSSNIGDDVEFIAIVTQKDTSTFEVTGIDGLTVSGDDSGFFYGMREVTDANGTVTDRINVLHAVDEATGAMTFTYKSQSFTVTPSVPAYSFGTRRYIPDDITARKAVSYSGYREGDTPDTQTYPEQSQILEDLNLLIERDFGFIRLFDTSVHAYRTIDNIANNNLPMKVQLGVWIAGTNAKQSTANWKQIDGALSLIAAYPDVIASISIGNECMVDWNNWASCTPQDMKKYIQYMRTRVSVPITTDDNWEPFARTNISNDDGIEQGILASGNPIYRNDNVNTPYETDPVANVIDYLSLHTYPIADTPWGIWDWQRESVAIGPARGVAMMDLAFLVAQKQYQAARNHLDDIGLTDLPIFIGETGWKHADTNSWPGRSHPVNAKMYYDRINDWVYGTGRGATAHDGPWVCFYFEAFDEPWKKGDDGWGFWDKDRKPLYVLTGEGYTEADVDYYGK